MFFGGFPFFEGNEDDEEQGVSGKESKSKEIDNSSLYEVLGVTIESSQLEIKKAFMKFAKEHHPDKGGDIEKFKEYQSAYEILSDPEKRKLYNQYGIEGVENEGRSGGGVTLFDLLNGGRRSHSQGQGRQSKMRPRKEVCSVSLEDCFHGKLVKFKINRQRNCIKCDGKGGSEIQKCEICDGRGMKKQLIQRGNMIQQFQQKCDSCNGEGQTVLEENKCTLCQGLRVFKEEYEVEVPIEKGSFQDQQYVMHGQADEGPGILAGDLIVIILVEPHPVFTRIGADLYIEKQICLLEALGGFMFEFTTLDNQQVVVASESGDIISDGTKKILKNYGMPFYKDQMSHGNLIINFRVEFPKKGSLSTSDIETLSKILPKAKPYQVDSTEKYINYLIEFDPSLTNSHEQGGNRDEVSDDERTEKVQCAQQ